MLVFMFMPQFVRPIQEGTKSHTIRFARSHRPPPGMPLSLRTWQGKPYRSKQTEIHQTYVANVVRLTISKDGDICRDGVQLGHIGCENLAVSDGFPGHAEMVAWHEEHNGLPFSGVLLEWDDEPRLYEGCQARVSYVHRVTLEVTVLAIRGKHAMVKERRAHPTIYPIDDLIPMPYWKEFVPRGTIIS